MNKGRTTISIALALALTACGGGGGGNSGGNVSVTPTPTPTPTPTTATCSLDQRKQTAFDIVNEWYLFPDLVDTSLNAANFNSVQDYLDALVAPARAQNKDRFFTYVTSIAEEDALINSGASAGFGIRLGYDTSANRVFVIEGFENGPGLPAGLDRGAELLAIGTSSSNLQDVSSLMASGGPQAVINALGPSDAGISRVLRFRTAAGVTTESNITKTEFALDPVSDRYGVKIIDDGGKKVGYLNLRTFIVEDASNQLRTAFGQFKAQGVTELIIDLRYNGGGLIDVAEVLGDLLGKNYVGQVFSKTVFRPSKAANNSTELFQNETNAIAPTKIAFIGTRSSASASELIMNSMLPYLGNNMALIGNNTFGKPVGQSGFSVAACDDRYRVVTLKTVNANDQGEYFNGLATIIPNTCRANDDITLQLGDPAEASVRSALDFLAGRACTPIAGGGQTTTQSIGAGKTVLQPRRPNAAQHEVPGLY